MLTRIALWGPLMIAALLIGGYIYIHDPFARDGRELLAVPLSEEDLALDQVGELKYLGGLDIPRMDQNIGGLSGLRWDAESGRLLAITDDARWVWLTLEEADGTLTGISAVKAGPLLGLDGEVLSGKEQGDSESLSFMPGGEWLVGFERDHRILSYGGIDPYATSIIIDLEGLFGPLEDNRGLEAIANNDLVLLLCVERQATIKDANCRRSGFGAENAPFPVHPPSEIEAVGAVPTDADALSDGTVLILFRSWSNIDGNRAAVVSYSPDGTRRELLTLGAPLTVDNFEGLAVREEAGRTFLYIVSDDNFSGSQRTLLMKFEVPGGS